MKTTDIRKKYLDYFISRGHTSIPSSSLVPGNDPTLLFTNAGMVPFKDVFLGRDKLSYVRATSSQRCVRAGGKHNDLENVGYTARHHTFFEMLGNFSFGDYFKKEAIEFAWGFLTQELQLPADKLWVTVFDEDEEAAAIWINIIGLDPSRCLKIGAKDNFWSMGDTGPCGPCSEIFYDHGPEMSGGLPGTAEEDGDRYVEIWNLVFMQFDRKSNGEMVPLPKPSVDTGMGLERLAAVMQKVTSNYEIDLFQHLIHAAAKAVNMDDLNHVSLRVIADHIRSCSFLIVDGILPSNEGRGYVLRRIIRRAARHGFELGMKQAFFYQLVDGLCEEMGEAYPELENAKEMVKRTLKQEEERFSETLEHGLKILDEVIANLNGKVIPGETVFKLYDTFGFPVDLTEDIALNRGLTLDHEGFRAAMEVQRIRARAASNFDVDYGDAVTIETETQFTGYTELKDSSTVLQLIADGEVVEHLDEGKEGLLVLAKTPFYAESGGQAGDVGELKNSNVQITVKDTQKRGQKVFLHNIKVVKGLVAVGDELEAWVNVNEREETECNHSATHLLHAALRQILGDHVEQKGSLVNAQRLRFDFSHSAPLTVDEINEVERIVNFQIRGNNVIEANVMPIQEAKNLGAMALFGEKYGDEVRVLRMGDFSVELCGGTHVKQTGDIGLLKVTSEAGIASGVRRIEAVTAGKAIAWIQANENGLDQIADMLKSKRTTVADKVEQLLTRQRKLEKELDRLKLKMASAAGSDLSSAAKEIGGIQVVAAKLESADVKSLRDTVDQLKNKLGTAAIVLAAVDGDKIKLVAGVTKDATDRIKAGDLVSMVARQVGGKGGGRADMAQAGGTDPTKLTVALSSVFAWVSDQLK